MLLDKFQNFFPGELHFCIKPQKVFRDQMSE
jgi:hypothetical protein